MVKDEKLLTAVRIWGHSTVSLVDIRHSLITPDDPVENEEMSANMFFCINGGKAEVRLSDTFYLTRHCGIFHGGKGTVFSLRSKENELEMYQVLYRVGQSSTHRQELEKLMRCINPFSQCYGFVPENPLFFIDQLRTMHRCWQTPTPLHQLFEKSALYRLVYEVYAELGKGQVRLLQPDVAAQVIHHIDTHYSDDISIRALREDSGLSATHFNRLVKRRTGKSPRAYLTSVRLLTAQQLLRFSDMTLKEIAHAVGFYDEYHLSHTFKRHLNMTPQSFRQNHTLKKGNRYIGNASPVANNVLGIISSNKLTEEQEGQDMFKGMKMKAAVAVALGAALMLPACGTPGTDAQSDREQNPTPAQEQTTRVVETIMGDVEVPSHPQRIISAYVDGDILALGGNLIAADEPSAGCAYYDRVVSLPRIDSWDPESIMMLEPDLIFVIMEEDYQKLKDIAPTILIPFGEMGTLERVRFIGEVLGVPEKAEELIADFQSKADGVKATLEAHDAGIHEKTITILEMWEPGSIMVVGDRWGRGGDFIYNSLGIAAPERIREEIIDTTGEDYILISEEVMPDYCGDIILVTTGEDGTTGFEGSAIWESLPAVRNGRLIEVSWNLFYFDDILSLNAQLDVVADALLAMSV